MDELLTTADCTMPTAGRPLRLAEFDALFASVTAVHHEGTVTRLHLGGGPGLADRVRDLTDRESQCCSFFTFTVTGSDTEVDLEIEVPPQHRSIGAAIAARASELAP